LQHDGFDNLSLLSCIRTIATQAGRMRRVTLLPWTAVNDQDLSPTSPGAMSTSFPVTGGASQAGAGDPRHTDAGVVSKTIELLHNRWPDLVAPKEVI
jgi:hypothetical protein